MILVVGMHRSGTSKVMQWLDLQAVPYVGEKFPPWIVQRIRDKEPLGHYEGVHTTGGLTVTNEFIAAKVLITPLIHACRFESDPLIVLCERGYLDMANSQRDYNGPLDANITGALLAACNAWTPQHQADWNARLYSKFDTWATATNRRVIRIDHDTWISQGTEQAKLAQALSQERIRGNG